MVASDAAPAHPNDEPFRPLRDHPIQATVASVTADALAAIPEVVPAMVKQSTASAKPNQFLDTAIAEFQPKGTQPMSSPTGFVPGEISAMFKQLRARKDAMVTDIMANGADVAATLAAGEAMSAQLKAEGDAMKAEFGLLTNGPPV